MTKNINSIAQELVDSITSLGLSEAEVRAVMDAVTAKLRRLGHIPSPKRQAFSLRPALTEVTKPASAQAEKREKRTLPELPSGLSWPTGTYSASPEAERGGGGIKAYLERVWQSLLNAAGPGVIDLRILRTVDESAAMGVNNLKRGGKQLPAYLDFPTLAETNDRALAASGMPTGVNPRETARLAMAAHRRGNIKP